MRDAIVKADNMRDAIVKDLIRDAIVKSDNFSVDKKLKTKTSNTGISASGNSNSGNASG